MSGRSEIRLQVYLAGCGIASRRACERYIANGRVRVNGELVTTPGSRFRDGDTVEVDGRIVVPQDAVYLAVHKPEGVVCSSSPPEGMRAVQDLLGPEMRSRVFHVGRLDYLSSGLIFYTSDGAFAHRVMHPSFGVEREYRLLSDQPVSDTFLRDYERGITIDGVRYTAKHCRRGRPLTVTITLLEGKNREIRRVCAAGGVRITRLIRQRIGCVGLAGIARGGYRHLTIPEIDWFSPRASAKDT